MEVIKERRGRVRVGKRETRPITVHYRTVPMLTDAQRERVREWAGCLLVLALILLAGYVEGSSWPI